MDYKIQSIGECCSSGNIKGPAMVEEALERLKKVLSENGRLSYKIRDAVLSPAPECEACAKSLNPPTLYRILEDISDKAAGINDVLSHVAGVLEGQLGDIKLD